MQLWKIKCLLSEFVDSDDLLIKDMTLKMVDKFTKYYYDL